MKIIIRAISILVILSGILSAQKFINNEPMAHTFSIVARDAETGEMAVGVQSHWFSVGTVVAWGKSGVGVVATQSLVNVSFGPRGLKILEEGNSPKETMKKLIESDEGRDFRQVAILDVKGNVESYTGKKCIAEASHKSGDGFSVQANMMLNNEVVPAMEKAFAENKDLPLAERVVEVLKAAQKAGGDIRGKQSAALIVVGPDKVENSWEDKLIDLRVDDHKTPVKELERLLKVQRAYEHMNKGDLAIEKNDMKLALKEYSMAEKLLPNNLEVKYWKAVTLANNGYVEKSIPLFKEIFDENDNWKELTKRLPKSDLLNIDKKDLEKILSL